MIPWAVILLPFADFARDSVCLASIPRSEFERTVFFLEATALPGSSAILPSADLLGQSVAARMREILGAKADDVPAADSLVDWRHTWASLDVVARRNGTFSWSQRKSSGPDSTRSAAHTLLLRAISAVQRDEGPLPWPQSALADSLSFSLTLRWPTVRPEGRINFPVVRAAFPVFALDLPWTTAVEQLQGPRITYPERLRKSGQMGHVKLQFVVDSKGRAVQSTIKEIPSEGTFRSAFSGENRYTFVSAVKRGLSSARFSPARIGGCATDQLVTQVFEFKLHR